MSEFKCKCGETSHPVLITIGNEEVICQECVDNRIRILAYENVDMKNKLDEIESILNN